MSRSIHTVWKDCISERRLQYSDNDHKDNRLKQMHDDLLDKSLIKKKKLLQRKQENLTPNIVGLFNPSALNIEIQEKENMSITLLLARI